MGIWMWLLIAYVALAGITLLPTLLAIARETELYASGESFDESPHFSEEGKLLLKQNYSRIIGTLRFWKKRATIYTRFHYYCVIWTILSSWMVPLLSTINSGNAKANWLITAVASHVALALSFHRGLNVAENMKAFRHGESEFYDLCRRSLDRPGAFGETEEDQLDSYFEQVELVRDLPAMQRQVTLPAFATRQRGIFSINRGKADEAT